MRIIIELQPKEFSSLGCGDEGEGGVSQDRQKIVHVGRERSWGCYLVQKCTNKQNRAHGLIYFMDRKQLHKLAPWALQATVGIAFMPVPKVVMRCHFDAKRPHEYLKGIWLHSFLQMVIVLRAPSLRSEQAASSCLPNAHWNVTADKNMSFVHK